MAAIVDEQITLPDGASGVSLQKLSGTIYWSFERMTGNDQGFKLGNNVENIWLQPTQTPSLYLYGVGTVIHQMLSPQSY